METRDTATEYVTTAIENGDATRDDFDVPAIVDELHATAGGTWDFTQLDTDLFWQCVERYEKTQP